MLLYSFHNIKLFSHFSALNSSSKYSVILELDNLWFMDFKFIQEDQKIKDSEINSSWQIHNDLLKDLVISVFDSLLDFQDRAAEMSCQQTKKPVFDIMFSSHWANFR